MGHLDIVKDLVMAQVDVNFIAEGRVCQMEVCFFILTHWGRSHNCVIINGEKTEKKKKKLRKKLLKAGFRTSDLLCMSLCAYAPT